jgi:hypothetical protein
VWGNTASLKFVGYGGGVYLAREAPLLRGNVVQSNTATAGMGRIGSGGGVTLDSVDGATLSGNTVRGNTASADGEGYGGGVSLVSSSGVEVLRNTIEGNRATTAAYRANGGGVYAGASHNLRLVGNRIRGNVASTAGEGNGGGVYLDACEHTTLSANTILTNVASLEPAADGDGGAVYVGGSGPVSMANNLVARNHANHEGGGLYFGGSPANHVSASLLHSTIADNASDAGFDGVLVHSYSTLAFSNTIISGHGATGLWVNNANSVSLETTLWHGNGEDIHIDGGVVTTTVDVYGDPAFVDPDALDYRITSGSAAIDAGIDAGVTEDIDGDPRPVGAAPDIGADEFRLRFVYLPLITRS